MATLCANKECINGKEDRGGRKRYNPVDKLWYCDECFQVRTIGEPGKNIWDYSTTHFDGKPQYIGSLANMRRLEKQYGVSNQAANYMQRNW